VKVKKDIDSPKKSLKAANSGKVSPAPPSKQDIPPPESLVGSRSKRVIKSTALFGEYVSDPLKMSRASFASLKNAHWQL
jgi:hypothetical protein